MIGEYIMAIDKNRIKNFENNNAKNVKSKNVDKVNMELLLTLNETTGLIQEEKCKDAVPFILWNDFVNRCGTLSSKINRHYNRYTWGSKVFVDFGMTNIQTELSYPHPAILVYNFNNTAIVIPTTTDDKITAFTSDIERAIIKVKSDGIIFPNDSIINVHQICSIHKERIISDLHCNVKSYIVPSQEIDRLNQFEKYRIFQYGSNLLECIKFKLFSLFDNNFLCQVLENEAYDINEKINLKKRVEILENENNKLKEHIDNNMSV